MMGTLIIGDLNVHQRKWLRFSSEGNTVEGTLLQTTCATLGLSQLVHEPTRYENLLDLVLTNISSATVKVLPTIADHSVLLCTVRLKIPVGRVNTRMVWDFVKADWMKLGDILDNTDWSFINDLEPDQGALP